LPAACLIEPRSSGLLVEPSAIRVGDRFEVRGTTAGWYFLELTEVRAEPADAVRRLDECPYGTACFVATRPGEVMLTAVLFGERQECLKSGPFWVHNYGSAALEIDVARRDNRLWLPALRTAR
jgi:hypothetical protein